MYLFCANDIQESERSCICSVLMISLLPLSVIFLQDFGTVSRVGYYFFSSSPTRKKCQYMVSQCMYYFDFPMTFFLKDRALALRKQKYLNCRCKVWLFQWGSCCSIISCLCSVLQTVVCQLVCFLLVIVFPVIRFPVSDYPFGKPFLLLCCIYLNIKLYWLLS